MGSCAHRQAWRIAFAAAEHERVSTLGDLMLGINAHVNHDLALIYDRLGARNHDDHLHVNVVLGRAQAKVYPELIARHDPTLAAQTPNDPTLSLDIAGWREQAWNHALQGPDPGQLERDSAALARRIRAAFPVTREANRRRDAYCEAHA